MRLLTLCLVLVGCVAPVSSNTSEDEGEGIDMCPEYTGPDQHYAVTVCNAWESNAQATGCVDVPCPWGSWDTANHVVSEHRRAACFDMLAGVSSCTELRAMVQVCRATCDNE